MARGDLELLLAQWTLGDKLQRLMRLAPTDVKAIEELTDDALRRRWPTAKRWLHLVRTPALPRKTG